MNPCLVEPRAVESCRAELSLASPSQAEPSLTGPSEADVTKEQANKKGGEENGEHSTPCLKTTLCFEIQMKRWKLSTHHASSGSRMIAD